MHKGVFGSEKVCIIDTLWSLVIWQLWRAGSFVMWIRWTYHCLWCVQIPITVSLSGPPLPTMDEAKEQSLKVLHLLFIWNVITKKCGSIRFGFSYRISLLISFYFILDVLSSYFHQCSSFSLADCDESAVWSFCENAWSQLSLQWPRWVTRFLCVIHFISTLFFSAATLWALE